MAKELQESVGRTGGVSRLRDPSLPEPTREAVLLHEARNVLCAVLSELDSAQAELEGMAALPSQSPRDLVEVRAAVHNARDGAVFLRDLMRDLLGARDDAGDRADLTNVLRRSIALTRHAFGGRTVELELAEIPRVQGSERRLVQVFVNLLTNAAEAIAASPDPRIRVVVARCGPEVIVEIHDTGRGIAAEVQADLFRVSRTTKQRGGVHGLGLLICRRIVTDCGGSILARSSTGAGTVFRVSLRAVDA